MQEYSNTNIESSASFVDLLMSQDELTTGQVRYYVEENCPFIYAMFKQRGRWADFNIFAYQHLGRIEGVMRQVSKGYGKNKVRFFNREAIDAVERSYALTSIKALDKGVESLHTEYTSEWAIRRNLAYTVKADWAKQIAVSLIREKYDL
jgi:hypothetical protein